MSKLKIVVELVSKTSADVMLVNYHPWRFTKYSPRDVIHTCYIGALTEEKLMDAIDAAIERFEDEMKRIEGERNSSVAEHLCIFHSDVKVIYTKDS